MADAETDLKIQKLLVTLLGIKPEEGNGLLNDDVEYKLLALFHLNRNSYNNSK